MQCSVYGSNLFLPSQSCLSFSALGSVDRCIWTNITKVRIWVTRKGSKCKLRYSWTRSTPLQRRSPTTVSSSRFPNPSSTILTFLTYFFTQHHATHANSFERPRLSLLGLSPRFTHHTIQNAVKLLRRSQHVCQDAQAREACRSQQPTATTLVSVRQSQAAPPHFQVRGAVYAPGAFGGCERRPSGCRVYRPL